MKPIFIIIKKELQSFFNSPIAYIFFNVFLLLSGWLFFQNFFLIGQAEMRGFFNMVPWLFLFLIPAITMRTWAEEKKLGTHELLLTMPISDSALITGKFLSCVAIIALALIFSFPIAAVTLWAGSADFGVIVASYLGALLLGASYASLGVLFSAMTDNQIIAFIVTLVACFLFFIVSELFFLQNLPSFLTPIFQFFGVVAHSESLSRGVIDTRDVIFFITFIFFFLYLNKKQIAKI